MASDGMNPQLAADASPGHGDSPQIVGLQTQSDVDLSESEQSDKLYDINRIQAFEDVPFLISRMEHKDTIVTYGDAVEQIQALLDFLRMNEVPAGAGIALRITEHTPATSLMILAILNNKGHFFPTDKMTLSQDLCVQMSTAGVDYLLVNKHLTVAPLYFTFLGSILVFEEDCRLYTVKLKSADHAVQTKQLPANMCYTISTTGTTGKPKLIHVPYECIAPNIVGLSQKLNVSMADIIYLGTPITFDPFVVEFFLALHNGATLLTSRHSMRDSPSKVLSALFPDNLATPGITILQMTPSLFRQFGASSIRERVLGRSSSLRVLLLGGEPFPSNVELVTWMNPSVLLQKHICNIYGITEISCWSLLHIVQSLQSPVPLGTPIDKDTVIRIESQNDETSQQGELFLGSSRRRCYIPEIDDQANALKDDSGICFRATGDLVTRRQDGTLFYSERSNDVVKRAGNRISLGLITRKIQKCLPSTELTTCLWLEDLQKLICCIRSLVSKTRVEQRVQTFDILSKVSIAEQPDRFVYLQHFPCNVHGKLDKQQLLKMCIPLAQPAQQILKSYLHDRLEYVEEPDDTLAKRQRLDDAAPCGYDLSFRHAGGTSFHAITICREIGLQMCIDDEQRHLFEMLLDENIPLRTVLRFLDTAKLVANNIKRKNVEPAVVASSCQGALVIKRIEQPVLKLQFYWKVNFEKCIDSPVTEYEGRFICVGAHSKILRTLNPQTGSEYSTVKLPDRIECKVTFLSEQLAMVGCYDGCLYGFNPQTGDIVFRVGIGGMIKSQPMLTADGRRIIVCSYADDYNVYCLSAERQEVLWCLRIGEKPIFASPLELPREQSLIICTLDGSYSRVAITDGSVEWTQKYREPVFSTPVLLESMSNIFLSAEVAGRVHACHVGNGKILATFSAEGNIFSSLVVKTPPTFMGHSFAVFGCIDQHVYCLRCKAGSGGKSVDFELHWKVNVGAPVYATPTLLTVQPNGLLVWCAATDGRVMLMNFRNGEIQWSDKLPGQVFSSACFIDDLRRVFVGCRDNFLYCLGI